MTTPANNNMHPSDMRNMIIFALASLLLWFAFDHFVLKPQVNAIKAEQIATTTGTTAAPNVATPVTPKKREDIIASPDRIMIDTPEITGSISLKGARIDDISFKKHDDTLHSKKRVVLFSPAETENAYFADAGWLGAANSPSLPTKDSVWTKVKGDKLTPTTPITFIWDNGAGLKFERTISIDEKFLITIRQRMTNVSNGSLVVYPFAAITRHGIPSHSQTVGYEGPLGYIGEDLIEAKYDGLIKKPEQTFDGQTGWIGITDKYWFASLIPDQKQKQLFRFLAQPNEAEKAKSIFQVDARGDAVTSVAGQTIENTQHIFVGVKDINALENYEAQLGTNHFDLAVDFGKLYFLTRPMNWLIGLFNSWVGNFGVAIILLTVVVRAAVFPLANVSYRSFAGMRKIAPKMAELRVKYGDDKQKMQQELIALYQTEKVNPMAGCLPLLLQIPIFFAVYKVISIAVDMRHAPFFGWIHDLSAVDPLSIFNLFGLLPFDVPNFLHIGPWSIAMLCLMLIQKHFNPPPQDQMQKDIANFMPWVITFILAKFPSGLVIYWTFSNLISVIQQYCIMRSMNVPVYLFSKDEALAYEAQHSSKVNEAKEKAVEEVKAKSPEKPKEVVEEALFGAPPANKDEK